jgi:trans-aconitate 2-methyltransferase
MQTPKPTVQWDASDYAKHSQGQYGWAMGNIGKLRLQGNESVLDVGCGDGKVTAEIARLLPRGRVVGVDQSEEMIALATRLVRLPNVKFRVLDGQRLDFNEEFDAIFSNSALHWMPDQRAAILGIGRALKPGGRLFLSMGGRGTASLVFKALDSMMQEERWAQFLTGVVPPHHFKGPQEYEPWLAEAGLHADRIELVQKPMRLADAAALEGWHRTTWMTYTARFPENQRGDFLRELTKRVAANCTMTDDGGLLMPMVNLEVEAHKDTP